MDSKSKSEAGKLISRGVQTECKWKPRKKQKSKPKNPQKPKPENPQKSKAENSQKPKPGKPKASQASDPWLDGYLGLNHEPWAHDYNSPDYYYDYYARLHDWGAMSKWNHFYSFPWKYEGYGDYNSFCYPWAYNRSWNMWVWEGYSNDPWELPSEAFWDPWEAPFAWEAQDPWDTYPWDTNPWDPYWNIAGEEAGIWVWTSEDSSETLVFI